MKAYTPEQASGSTSSAVKVPQVSSLKNSALMGSTPLTTYHGGPSPSGNPHVNNATHAFNTPTHGASLTGAGSNGVHVQNNEVRNSANGIPHIVMKPGA